MAPYHGGIRSGVLTVNRKTIKRKQDSLVALGTVEKDTTYHRHRDLYFRHFGSFAAERSIHVSTRNIKLARANDQHKIVS